VLAGQSTCEAKSFTCIATGLEKGKLYEVTVTASVKGKTDRTSSPIQVATAFGTLSGPKSSGAPTWDEKTSSWIVGFTQPQVNSATKMTVTASPCAPSLLTQANVDEPTQTELSDLASKGKLFLPARTLAGIPVEFALQASELKSAGSTSAELGSGIVQVPGCWLTPLPTACYGTNAASGIKASFDTTSGVAKKMFPSFNATGCQKTGIFQPVFRYRPIKKEMPIKEEIPIPCGQLQWQVTRVGPTSCNLKEGIDLTNTALLVDLHYVIPQHKKFRFPDKFDITTFKIPAKSVVGSLPPFPPFRWNSDAPVSVRPLNMTGSGVGHNGWSSFSVVVGTKQKPFWNPWAQTMPDQNALKPSVVISCGLDNQQLTDTSIVRAPEPLSPDGVLTYTVNETTPSSSTQVDVDLSKCQVTFSFTNAGSLRPFTPSPQPASLSLYPSDIPVPNNSWFGQCTTTSGKLGVIFSNTASGCDLSKFVVPGGFASNPAPGQFISVTVPGCTPNENLAKDGVAFTCDSSVDPSTVHFDWKFAGQVSQFSLPTQARASGLSLILIAGGIAILLLLLTLALRRPAILGAGGRRRAQRSSFAPLQAPLTNLPSNLQSPQRGPIATVFALAPATLMNAGRRIMWFGYGAEEVNPGSRRTGSTVVPSSTDIGMVWSARPRKNIEIYGGWSEKTVGKGEDAPPVAVVSTGSDRGALCIFDGTGGAGASVVHRDDGEATQAFEAAHLGRATFHQWIAAWVQSKEGFPDADDLKQALAVSFAEHAESLDPIQTNLNSSFARILPTTMASILFSGYRNHVKLRVLWAGDSRCYQFTPLGGLQQLSLDDTKIPDAFESLTEDPPLENLVCADRLVLVNSVDLQPRKPVVIITASDGCFGYWPTPPMFEAELLRTLVNSSSPTQWADQLLKVINEVARDDVSFSIAAVGFESFEAMKAAFTNRAEHLRTHYYQPFVDLTVSSPSREDYDAFRRGAWEQYKPTYEAMLPLAAEEQP